MGIVFLIAITILLACLSLGLHGSDQPSGGRCSERHAPRSHRLAGMWDRLSVMKRVYISS